MTLQDKLGENLKKALTERNEMELSLYRMLKSAIKNKEIELRRELGDDEVVVILEKESKQRKDSIEQYRNGNREDLAAKEEAELKIIEAYLPQKMDEEEVREIVKEIIRENKEADFGRLMGSAMAELKGKADGSLVQKIVREETGK